MNYFQLKNSSCQENFSPASRHHAFSFETRSRWFDTQKRRRSRRFTLKDFHYDETLDQYSCPDGKVLKLQLKDVLTMVTFTEDILLLKKIVGVACYDPGVSMGRTPNVSI
jgi:hypothetical protein